MSVDWRRPFATIPWPGGWKRLALVLAVLVTIHGGLLRLEALYGKYGRLDHPEWSHALSSVVVPTAQYLRPERVRWRPDDEPYVGGDPINYIVYAREMTHFYQAHVREPMFLALTRGFLWLTGGRDVSVSFASATAGTLAIFATYLLGSAAFSRAVGLGAAWALAIEVTAIMWSVDGWRDDLFMLFVALSAWSLIRLRQHPSRRTAIVAGAMTAGACLTRITALSFVAPALGWIVFEGRKTDQRAAAVTSAGLAALVMSVLVAPYLISCAIATGDPFYAINYHTRYYRAAEGLAPEPSIGVVEYVTDKLVRRPITTADTATVGLFVWPFTSKWRGFSVWSDGLSVALQWAAAIGLLLCFRSTDGRILLVILVTSVAPYALTWSLGGGGEWRFTAHTYPIYLVAAFASLAAATGGVVAAARGTFDRQSTFAAAHLIRIGVVAVAASVALVVYFSLPFFGARESLAAGDGVTIEAGDRGWWFFADGWSETFGRNIEVRAAASEVASMRLPIPPGTNYWLTLRLDPAETAEIDRQPVLTVFFNGHAFARIRPGRNPDRMGSYRYEVPSEWIGGSTSRLDFMASHTVPASQAGPHFASLSPDSPVAFRLWYVRLQSVDSR